MFWISENAWNVVGNETLSRMVICARKFKSWPQVIESSPGSEELFSPSGAGRSLIARLAYAERSAARLALASRKRALGRRFHSNGYVGNSERLLRGKRDRAPGIVARKPSERLASARRLRGEQDSSRNRSRSQKLYPNNATTSATFKSLRSARRTIETDRPRCPHNAGSEVSE